MPALLMDRLAKVAVPAPAWAAAVPLRGPPPGFVRMATVTGEESATRLPKASSTWTLTAGLMLAPAATLPGCTLNDRWSAAAAVMVKRVDVAEPREPSAALRL